jgi:hypothetical protein
VTSEDIQDAGFLLRLGERERRRPRFEESLFPRMTQQEIHQLHLARHQQDHDAAALEERMRDVMSREIDEWMVTRSGPEEAETTFLAELASYGSPAGADDGLPPYQGPSHTSRLQYESQQSLQCQDSTHQNPYQQQDSHQHTLSQQDKKGAEPIPG